MPKRSISAAANGAVRPNSSRLTETASEMVPRDQPNSSCSGSISAPGVARKPAAPMSATKATAATSQARCSAVAAGRLGRSWSPAQPDRSVGRRASGRTAIMCKNPAMTDRSPIARAPGRRARPGRGRRLRPRDAAAGLRRGPRRRRSPALRGAGLHRRRGRRSARRPASRCVPDHGLEALAWADTVIVAGVEGRRAAGPFPAEALAALRGHRRPDADRVDLHRRVRARRAGLLDGRPGDHALAVGRPVPRAAPGGPAGPATCCSSTTATC